MAELEDGIVTRLGAFAATAALLVNEDDTIRVHPMRLPQSSPLPAVTYQRIGGPRAEAFGASTGFVYQRIQLDCWGGTYAETQALALAVKQALHRWTQGSGPEVKHSELQRDTDLDALGAGVARFRRSQDYVVLHEED